MMIFHDVISPPTLLSDPQFKYIANLGLLSHINHNRKFFDSFTTYSPLLYYWYHKPISSFLLHSSSVIPVKDDLEYSVLLISYNEPIFMQFEPFETPQAFHNILTIFCFG